MAFDGVPWFVSGTDPADETLRAMLWAAGGGGEGIVASTDLRVTALGAPSDAVVVGPGSAVASVRTAGSAGEAYAIRSPTSTTVDVTPTGPAGPRTDLVVARVEDPNIDGQWPIPADVAEGPYVYVRIVEDVPPGTTSLQQVAGHTADSAVTLARLDIPGSTSSITQAMITDLRTLAQPRTSRTVRYLSGTWATPDLLGAVTDEWEQFPLGASFVVAVPPWATSATVEAEWVQLAKSDTVQASGDVRVQLGAAAGAASSFSVATAGRHCLIAGADFGVAAADRGTVMTVTLQGKGDPGNTGTLSADAGTTVKAVITFHQTPSSE